MVTVSSLHALTTIIVSQEARPSQAKPSQRQSLAKYRRRKKGKNFTNTLFNRLLNRMINKYESFSSDNIPSNTSLALPSASSSIHFPLTYPSTLRYAHGVNQTTTSSFPSITLIFSKNCLTSSHIFLSPLPTLKTHCSSPLTIFTSTLTNSMIPV